eukprot:m.242615 g.242615  ORF g.242615 m.242615 type:complete len:313 (-) comp17137_c1_seq1:478-1416(-)
MERPVFDYEWNMCDGMEARAASIAERKAELQERILAAETNGEDIDGLLVEWTSLLEAQNQLFTDYMEKDNLRMKHGAMQDLHSILGDIIRSEVEFTSQEVRLKKCIQTAFSEVCKYLEMNNLPARQIVSSVQPPDAEMKDAAPEVISESTMAPPPPPPPPPPPVPSTLSAKPSAVSKSLSCDALPNDVSGDDVNEPEEPEENNEQENVPPTTAKIAQQAPRTPLREVNSRPFLRDISTTGRTTLKKTNLPRSPGGTPCRRKRHPAVLDSQDLITLALRNKFKSISQSPLSDTSSVFNSPRSTGRPSQPPTPF